VASGTQERLDQAFENPPTTDEQLLDPPTFLDQQKPVDVKEPSVPDGVSKEDVVDRGDFGALALLVVLGERIDPLVAMKAVDGWGGDAYVAYTQSGKTCMRLDVEGDTGRDTNELRDALVQWAAAMPPGASMVGSAGGGLSHLITCDPGTGSELTLNNRANDLVQLPATRSQFMLEAVQQLGFSVDKAFTFGDCVVRTLGFDTFVAADKAGAVGPSPDLQQTVQAAITKCR